LAIAQVFIIKSDYKLGGADYDRILKWMKNMLHEGNSLEDNFYAVKFMMKPLGLGFKKIYTSKLLHVVQWWIYKFYRVQNL